MAEGKDENQSILQAVREYAIECAIMKVHASEDVTYCVDEALQIYGGMDDVGIALTAGVTLVIFITAVLASVGAAAVPDAGLITMVLVADAVHLPVYYIPLIFTVDALLDMFRTSTNIMGDAVGAVIVDRFETDAPPEPAAAPAAA